MIFGGEAMVPSATTMAPQRILIVDDEPFSLEVARSIVELAGLEGIVVDSGESAVRQAQQGRFAAILMDIQMPGMDGVEASGRIRQIPGYEDVPILALTANAFAEDIARYLAAGISQVLTKPLDLDKLLQALQTWLDDRSASRADQADRPS